MRRAQEKERILYRSLIRHAAETAWRRRDLWPLGVFAALLMMNGGAFEFITRAYLKIASGSPYDGAVAYVQSVSGAVESADPMTRASLFIAILLGAAVFSAFAVMATASGGALLKAASRLAEHKKITARDALSAGAKKIGPLLITQVVGRFTIFTSFALAAIGAYISFGNGWNDLAAIGLFVLFAITALIVSFLMIMTDAGIMINDERWIHAAHDACRFLRRHWLISIEMIGLIFAIAVAASLLALAVAVALLIPFTLILVAVSAFHAVSGLVTVAVVYEIAVLVAVFMVGAVLSVFQRAAWGFLYVKLSQRGALSKIERIWRSTRAKIHGRAYSR